MFLKNSKYAGFYRILYKFYVCQQNFLISIFSKVVPKKLENSTSEFERHKCNYKTVVQVGISDKSEF